MTLRELVEAASKMLWRWSALSPQHQLSNVVKTAIAYNARLADLLRGGTIPGLLLQSLEKTLIQYSGRLEMKVHPPVSRQIIELQQDEVTKARVSESKIKMPLERSGDRVINVSGLGPLKQQDETGPGLANQISFPNVALIMHSALSSAITRVDEAGSPAQQADRSWSLNNPERLAGNLGISNAVRYLMEGALSLPANDATRFSLASLVASVRTASPKQRLRPQDRDARSDAPIFSSQPAINDRSSETRRFDVTSRFERDPHLETTIKEINPPAKEAVLARGSPIDRAISIQRTIAEFVSAPISSTYQRKARTRSRKLPKATSDNEIGRARDFRGIVPLTTYVTSVIGLSSDSVRARISKPSPSTTSASQSNTRDRKAPQVPKQTTIGNIVARGIESIKILSQTPPIGHEYHLLQQVMHSLVAPNLISWRSQVPAGRAHGPSITLDAKFQMNDDHKGEKARGQAEAEIPQVGERSVFGNLFDFSFPLPYSLPLIRNVSNALSRSLRDAYGLQRGPILPDTPTTNADDSYTGPGRVTQQGIPSKLNLAEVASSHSSVAPGYKKKRIHPSVPTQNSALADVEYTKLASTEQSASDLVSGLQQVYSKYSLHSMIRRTKSGSSLLAVENPVQVLPLSTTQNGRKTDAISARRTRDGSDSLPQVTQLQAMLASHSVRKTGSVNGSIVLLSPDRIISSPVPATPFMRTARENRATSYRVSNIQTGHAEAHAQTVRPISPSKSDNEGSRFAKTQASGTSKRESSYKPLSLRELRKMMEQIFQEELKRYGL